VSFYLFLGLCEKGETCILSRIEGVVVTYLLVMSFLDWKWRVFVIV
jgi:hypothetical protein